MSEFFKATTLTDLAPGNRLLVDLDGRSVLLFRIEAQVFAIEDLCTHDDGPLSDGEFDGAKATIACPRHGAKFDVRTGKALTMPATKPTKIFEVKLEGDDVYVKV